MTRRLATSRVLQRPVLGPILFNSLINYTGDTEDTLGTSAADIKLGGGSDMVKCRASNQRGPEKFEEQANRNLMKFSNAEKKGAHPGQTNPHIGPGSGETARAAAPLERPKRDGQCLPG